MSEWRDEERRREKVRRAEVMGLPVLPVREQGVIGGRDGDARVCVSVGPAGEVAAVWTAAGDRDLVSARSLTAAGVSYAEPGTARPVPARITVHAPALETVTEIEDLTLAHVMIQPMPGGRFVVAGARCPWQPEGPARNALLYGGDGQVISAHVLGDGIGVLQATSSGHLWAGYFDEGIYGNYGWGHTEGDTPVGAYGLVRFSPALEPDWHLPRYDEIGPWTAISDCPTLNASDTGTWVSYDSDWPLVQIHDDTVTGWHNDIKAPAAIAVAGSRVVLAGGRHSERDRVAVTGLGADRAELAGEYRIVLPGGEPLPDSCTVTGRGSRLHVLTSTHWYQLDVDDIPR